MFASAGTDYQDLHVDTLFKKEKGEEGRVKGKTGAARSLPFSLLPSPFPDVSA
jgi:hypothetical protein